MQDNQKYIRIRMIGVGVVASSIYLDDLICNDVKQHNITKEQNIAQENLEQSIDDADIVFLVADMSDDFATKHLLIIINIINQNNKLFVSILANIDSTDDKQAVLLNDLRGKSRILIADNHYGAFLNQQMTTQQKFQSIISGLINLIDDEIVTITCLDDDFSSLITMNSFFEQKCELYLYLNYTIEEFKKIPCITAILDNSPQLWVRISKDINDSQRGESFIEYISAIIDDNASLYFTFKDDANEISALISTNSSNTKTQIAI